MAQVVVRCVALLLLVCVGHLPAIAAPTNALERMPGRAPGLRALWCDTERGVVLFRQGGTYRRVTPPVINALPEKVRKRAREAFRAASTSCRNRSALLRPTPVPVNRCGDNSARGAEICDGSDTRSRTCVTEGYFGGSLVCNGQCSGFDTANCTDRTTACSNGVRDLLEEGVDCGGPCAPCARTAGACYSWHIAPDGDNDQSGSGDFPLRTIAAALTRAEPCDTISIAGGTYNESLVPVRSGGPGKLITIHGPSSGSPAVVDLIDTSGHLGVIIDGITSSTLRQWGITWTLSAPKRAGSYVNGDLWVQGPVTVVGISPQPTRVSASYVRNGSMISPPTTGQHSYDSRAAGYHDPLYTPLPINVPVSSSLVSVESQPDEPECLRIGVYPGYPTVTGGCQENAYLKTAAILTVVESAPLRGSFRPPYVGNDKSSRWRIQTVFNEGGGTVNKLLSLTPPSSPSPPSASFLTRLFQRPWLNHRPGWSQAAITPLMNGVSYGRDVSRYTGETGLLLNLNLSHAEKFPLLVNYLQFGIDTYGLATNGMEWGPDGGHNSGRLFPIILSGFVLEDEPMLTIRQFPSLSGWCGDRVCFGDIAQTFYVDGANIGRSFTPPWQSTPRIYGDDISTTAVEQYTSAHVGMPEWGIRHGENPTTNATGNHLGDDKLRWSAGYRECCNALSWGGALLTSHLLGIRSSWDHPALFDYVDRYVEITQSTGWGLDPLPGAMWNLHRGNIGCRWTRDQQASCTNQNKEDMNAPCYSNGHYLCGADRYRCSWQNSTCSNCTTVASCSSYTTERACTYDPCQARCRWQGNSCVARTP